MSNPIVLDKQEMLNRAVRGLRSQNWEQCRQSGDKRCCYDASTPTQERHCGYGWIDTKQPNVMETAHGLLRERHSETWIGPVARELRLLPEDKLVDMANFLSGIQTAHDDAVSMGEMEDNYREFAKRHSLTWPE